MRKLNLILLAVATVLLVGMLNELGWANLGRHLLQVGYYWPLLLAPYGLVKMTSADTNMVLVKVLDHETSQITGEPQKMNFPGMPQ